MRKLTEIMSREVVTVHPDTNLRELAQTIAGRQVTAVPVVDHEGHPVGVVSCTDLTRLVAGSKGGALDVPLRDRGSPGRRRADLPEKARLDRLTAGEVMNRILVSVDETADLREAMDLMLSFHVHRVLVTRSGLLTGIVSTLDVVRAFREHLSRCGALETAPPPLVSGVGDMADEMDALLTGDPAVEE